MIVVGSTFRAVLLPPTPPMAVTAAVATGGSLNLAAEGRDADDELAVDEASSLFEIESDCRACPDNSFDAEYKRVISTFVAADESILLLLWLEGLDMIVAGL